MRPARLTVYQLPRNPTERERRILTLIAEGRTTRQTAVHLRVKLRSVTHSLERMRNRYTAPTNESLLVLALRLQWITIAIECMDTHARHSAEL